MTTRLEKPIRRALKIRGMEYVVELAPAGVMFRLHGGRRRHVAPIGEILNLALANTEREERRERLRAGVMRRIGR